MERGEDRQSRIINKYAEIRNPWGGASRRRARDESEAFKGKVLVADARRHYAILAKTSPFVQRQNFRSKYAGCASFSPTQRSFVPDEILHENALHVSPMCTNAKRRSSHRRRTVLLRGCIISRNTSRRPRNTFKHTSLFY